MAAVSVPGPVLASVTSDGASPKPLTGSEKIAVKCMGLAGVGSAFAPVGKQAVQ